MTLASLSLTSVSTHCVYVDAPAGCLPIRRAHTQPAGDGNRHQNGTHFHGRATLLTFPSRVCDRTELRREKNCGMVSLFEQSGLVRGDGHLEALGGTAWCSVAWRGGGEWRGGVEWPGVAGTDAVRGGTGRGPQPAL